MKMLTNEFLLALDQFVRAIIRDELAAKEMPKASEEEPQVVEETPEPEPEVAEPEPEAVKQEPVDLETLRGLVTKAVAEHGKLAVISILKKHGGGTKLGDFDEEGRAKVAEALGWL
jgi:hypothetical protein